MIRKLSDWASIAHIVSAIGVIITLIFLVIELRENTEITRVTAYESNIDSLNDVRSLIVNDPEMARIWQDFTNGTVLLDGPDRTRLEIWLHMAFGVYEESYFANRYGLLGLSEWSRFEKQICVQYERVLTIPSLIDNLRQVMAEEFMGHIDTSCAE